MNRRLFNSVSDTMRGNIKRLSVINSEQQLKELQGVVKDIFYFATFIFIVHPIRGRIKFDLYPFQKSVLWQFLNNRFNIVLKFRQAGLTELIALYCLWRALYNPNQNIQIISIKDKVAKRVLRRIKFMYKNLPDHLKLPIINGQSNKLGTAEELEFSNGSSITSIPTTEDAGRSEAVSLLVIDEAAILRWASTIWGAAFPTLSTGGSAIVNSTPFGIGNWYHQTWVEACSGGNDFNPIRLVWDMHPERDIHWYNEMRHILGPRRTAQEIDGDFLTSGTSVFDLMDIKAIEDNLTEYLPLHIRYNGNLRIYELPKKGEKYFIGADIASGRARDYSAFTITKRDGEEVACFKGKIPIEQFAKLLHLIGIDYNNALLAPEANDIGQGVIKLLQEWKYPNLYYTIQFIKEKGQTKPKKAKIPGWVTSMKNRHTIIMELEADIRNDLIIIKDPFFVQEAYTFIYNEQNRPVALGKDKVKGDTGDELFDQVYTDDSIIAKAITNFIRKGRTNSVIVAPK
jgi:hypothetical protein